MRSPAELERRRARIARVQAKKPRPDITAEIEGVEFVVDPVRRRRVGDALLRLLNSTGTPDEGR
jgi:hypothetical protein